MGVTIDDPSQSILQCFVTLHDPLLYPAVLFLCTLDKRFGRLCYYIYMVTFRIFIEECEQLSLPGTAQHQDLRKTALVSLLHYVPPQIVHYKYGEEVALLPSRFCVNPKHKKPHNP